MSKSTCKHSVCYIKEALNSAFESNEEEKKCILRHKTGKKDEFKRES